MDTKIIYNSVKNVKTEGAEVPSVYFFIIVYFNFS